MSALLFDKADIPRTPPVKRMHVVDAGTDYNHVHLICGWCGYDDGFRRHDKNITLTEFKRGIPCPECNKLGGDVQ